MVDLGLMKGVFYRIGFNTFVQILGKFFTTILSFISVGLLTRYLGQEGYGNFSLVFAYLSLFNIFSDLGLQITMVKELTKKEKLDRIVLGTYLSLKLFLVIFSTLLAIFFLILYHYSAFIKTGIILASLGVAVGNLSNFGTVIFQSKIRLDLVALVDTLVKFITTLMIALFIYLNKGFYYVINSVLIGNLFGALLIVILLKKFIKFNLEYDPRLARKLILKSLPIGLVSFLSAMYFKVDTIILSFYRSASEIGIYSLAYGIFENILVIWGFYMASIYPLMVKFLDDKEKFEKVWRSSIFIALGFSVIVIFLGYTFSPMVIGILGGKNFIQSSKVFRMILISTPFFLMNSIFYFSFYTTGKIKKLLFLVLVSLIFKITLNLLFVPGYGYMSCAVNTIIIEIVLLSLYSIFLSSKYNGRKMRVGL